jgi:glutaredoxin 3
VAKVEIYTSPFCGYCHRAKALLQRKGVKYTEFDVMSEPGKREEMTARAEGLSTVPQIFIDGKGIGGSDELHALDAAGQLDKMLKNVA